MDFSTENDTLSRISKALYGDALTLAVMDPKDISLLKKNARILKKDVFQQLTANIGRDKRLSSVPLCHRLSDGRWKSSPGTTAYKPPSRRGSSASSS